MIAARPEQVWDLVADITRVGEWSPECIRATWLGQPDRPQPGARFTGHNRLPNGFEYEVTCVVTDADPPRTFAWVVLDSSGDPAHRPRRGGTGSTRSPAAAAGSGSASPTDPAPATCGQPPRKHRTAALRPSPPGGTGCGPT
jgi:uncharacterized protein YndB with AHSA1/START domain